MRTAFFRRPVGGLLLAGGALMTLGFAPFFVWPLAVLSVGFLGYFVREARGWKQGFGAGFVWGLGHHVTALYWLPMAFVMDADGDWVTGLAGGIPAWLVVAVYGALGMGVCAALAVRWGAKVWRVGLFGALWVAMDMLKAASAYGFPWLPVGAVWAGNDVLIQAAANPLGVFGVGALVLLMGLSWAALPVRRAALVNLAVLAGALGWGWWRLDDGGPAREGPVVRLVQPDITSPHKWDPRLRTQFLYTTMDTAWAGPVPDMPDVVVMPETAVAFFMDEDEGVREALAQHMGPTETLVTGTVRRNVLPDGHMQFWNALVSMDAGGTILGEHDKHVLVPFGEFIPLRSLLDKLPLPAPLRTLSQSRLDFTEGEDMGLLPTAAGPALGLICYEGIFPWYVWRHAKGARWLVNVTNDNWFTGTIALYQHAALARLRAVETGLPLIRVANTGVSVAWDGKGRELGRLGAGVRGRVDVRLGLKK